VKALSGGNQQKVLFGRIIEQDARLVLLDEPTKGVDIGAKADIYAIIRDLAAQGRCVLVISSEERNCSRSPTASSSSGMAPATEWPWQPRT